MAEIWPKSSPVLNFQREISLGRRAISARHAESLCIVVRLYVSLSALLCAAVPTSKNFKYLEGRPGNSAKILFLIQKIRSRMRIMTEFCRLLRAVH